MPSSSATAAATGVGAGWWVDGALGLAIAGAFAVWLLRRRGAPADPGVDDSLPDDAATATTPASRHAVSPRIAGPAPSADRARLTLAIVPRRAGLNLLSATVEVELVVGNAGTVAAAGIRIGCALIGAVAGQGAETAPAFAGPVGRPAAPPFGLAPGEERRLRIVVALPRGEIRPLAVAGREMFVPVVTVNALYDAGGIAGQAARAFAIGVERVDSAKLAPLWLDQPPRMYETIGSRPYAAGIAL